MDRRKAMKLDYKQKQLPMGVYKIENLVNGKILLGSSPNLPGKFNSIRFQLEMGSHMNKELQRDWNELGEDKFSLEVVELLEPNEDPSTHKQDLETLEELWLERLQPYGDAGYNSPKR